MAAQTDDLEQLDEEQQPPIIDRSIGARPYVPSAPADAAPQYQRPVPVQPQQPGPIQPPGPVAPKPPLPISPNRQTNIVARQFRANENYQDQSARFNATEMYRKQQTALQEKQSQEAATRAEQATTFAAQEQEKPVVNTDVRNTLKTSRVETEQDPETGIVRPARDEQGNIKFRGGQDEQVALDKQLHGAARDALGEDVYKSALNLRQLQTTSVQKQEQLKQLRATAAGLEAKANETTGGFLGIGKSPTPEALAAKAELEKLNPQIDELQQAGYGKLAREGKLAEPSEVTAARKAHSQLTADKTAWGQLKITDPGQLNDALDERKASILAAGGDPSQDRIVQAIETKKKALGIVDKVEDPAEKALRDHPTYGPMLEKRDALDSQVKPIENVTNRLLTRLEKEVGFQTPATADQGDADARVGLLRAFTDHLTDPAQKGRVQTLLNALQPYLGQLHQAKTQRDFLQGQINLQTRPQAPSDTPPKQPTEQAAVSVADPSAAASEIKEQISAVHAPGNTDKLDYVVGALRLPGVSDVSNHEVAQKIKGFFYPLFGPNEEQAQHVYNSILKDGPSQHGLIPSLSEYVSNVSSVPNLFRAMALKAEGKDVTLDSIAEYKQRERQAAGLEKKEGDSKPWAVTKGIANSLLNFAESVVNPAFLSLPSSRVISAGFSAQMLSGIPEAIGRIKSEPTLQGKVEAATDAAVDLLAGGYAARHAMDASAIGHASRQTWKGSPETSDLVQEAIKTAKNKGVSPEFRSFFGGIDPEVAGTTPEKVAAFAKSLGMEWTPAPKADTPTGTTQEARQVEPPEAPKPAATAKPTTGEAHAEINGLQPSEHMAPEQVVPTQSALRGLVKISQGEPLEALTAEERVALLKKDENGIARVEMLPGADGKKSPVITDGALARVRAIAPTVAQMLPQDEQSQRQEILNANKSTETGSGETVKAAIQPGGKSSESVAVGTQKAVGTQQSTFAVEVQNAKGETKVVEQAAVTAKEARTAVAQTIKPGEGLIKDVTEVPKAPASAQGSGAVSPAGKPAGEDFVERAVQSASENKGKPLTTDEEKQVRLVARVFKPQVERWEKAFSGVDTTLSSLGGGGAAVSKGKRLTLSTNDFFAHLNEYYKEPAHRANVITEEAIHAVTVGLENRDAKGVARGPIDLVKIYQALPEKVQAAMRSAYKQPGADDWNYAHEFWRMWMQGDLELQRGNKIRLKGKFLQEQTSRKFVVENRKALATLLRFFRDMSGQLDKAKAGKDVIAEVAKAQNLIRAKVKEVDAHAQGASEKSGSEGVQNKTAVPSESASARGPPAAEPGGAKAKGGDTGTARADGLGRGVDAAPAETAAGTLEPAARSELAKRLNLPPEAIGNKSKVTQNGRTVDVVFVAQEAANARPSHDAQGRTVKGYDQSLQPRDRSLPQYRKQVQNIANNLDFAQAAFFPETKTPATTADLGAPVMTLSGDTLIGNGREIGIRTAYEQGLTAARQYKANFVRNAKAFGMDPAAVMKMKAPVLKRVILGDLSKDELVRLSQESNEGAAMGANASEIAGRDASRITPGLLSLFDPNYALDSAKNAGFLRAYARDVVRGEGANEANLNPSEMARRVRAAVFTYAYGADETGRAALQRLAGDESDAGGKNITNALLTVAPIVARMKTDIATGDLHSLDISSAISRAVQDISEALRNKSAKQSADVALDGLRNQEELLGGDSLTKVVTNFLIDNRTKRAAIEEALSNYVEAVFALGSPKQEDLFGERNIPAAQELWEKATSPEAIASKTGERALAAQSLKTGLREKAIEGGQNHAEVIREIVDQQELGDELGPDWYVVSDANGAPIEVFPTLGNARQHMHTMSGRGEWLWKIGKDFRNAALLGGMAEKWAQPEDKGPHGVYGKPPETRAQTPAETGEVPSYSPLGKRYEGSRGPITYFGIGYAGSRRATPRAPHEAVMLPNEFGYDPIRNTLRAQRTVDDSSTLDLFADYAATLPAAAKVSKPALKREVAKDIPPLADDEVALEELFRLAQSSPNLSSDRASSSTAIQDFGEKLGGARKDISASMNREISDDDIARLPLSEIWPKAEVDAIEDIPLAALATAARGEIPSKPRQGYKVQRWAEKVKQVRALMRIAGEQGYDAVIAKMSEYRLAPLVNKIRLLQSVPREHWGRIDRVENYPDAYQYNRGEGKNIPSPFAEAVVDGKRIIAGNLSELTDKVSTTLAGEAPTERMKFEVRGREGRGWFINKKGDPLYRKLKTFDDSKEAVAYARSDENYNALTDAWDAVKESDNVKETDVRRETNRDRTGKDWRNGKDATPEMFMDSFGFRGAEFGNWVSQGKNIKERQGMLNAAFDALHDLAETVRIPPKAISLNGTLGLGFGSRGHGWASAHFEPDNLVINLTKTRGAGSLAHEWFHALDNYFQRKRNETGIAGRHGDYITNNPETYYESPTGQRLSEARFKALSERPYNAGKINDWKRVDGVRPQVAEAFAELVKTLDASPMAKRAELIDKGKSDGYWSRIIERAARSFESYVIARMQLDGSSNDYLANVTNVENFARDKGRYPYLLADEIAPVSAAFEQLFNTLETKETEKGVALYSQPTNETPEESDRFKQGLPLAKQIARRYTNIRGSDAGDVEQHAEIALARAAKAFDPERGAFLPFARTAINNELRGLYRKGERNLEDTSLDETVEVGGQKSEVSKKDQIQSTSDTRSEVELAESRGVLDKAVSELPARMQGAINGILDGDTLDAIGQQLGGISRQAVGRLASEAMRRLRGKLGEIGITSARDLLAQPTSGDKTLSVPDENQAARADQGTSPKSSHEARPILTSEKVKDSSKVIFLPGGHVHVRINSGEWNKRPADLVTEALLDLTKESGVYWRGTNNRNEITVLDKLTSKNHAENRLEKGVSVSTGFGGSAFHGYKYYYQITGEVAGHGSDGEPVLRKARPLSKVMTLAEAQNNDRRETQKALDKIGWTQEQYRNALGRKYAPIPERSAPKTGAQTAEQQLDIISAHVADTLKAQASSDPLQQVMASLDVDELEKLFDKASAEERGSYVTGRPDLAMGAGEPSQRAVDQYYTDLSKPRTRETMQKEADQILADGGTDDFAKVIASRWLNGDTLRDSEVMAAKQVLAELSRQTNTPEGMRQMFAAGFAYRNIRGQTARDLAAGFDPHKSPEERNREFLTKVISTLPKKKEAEIAAEPDPEKRKTLLDEAMKERLEQLEKAFGCLSKGGLTLDDILNGSWELHGKGKEFLANQIQGVGDVRHQQAIKLAQTATRSAKDIAKATGLSEKEVNDTIDQFNDAMEKELIQKALAGLTYEKMNFEGALMAQPTAANAISLEQARAEARKIMRGMGYGVAAKDLGKFVVKKQKRKKLFVPPQAPGTVRRPNEDAAVPYPEGRTSGVQQEFSPPRSPNENAEVPYPEGQAAPYTGRVLGQPGLPLYAEMMVRRGADLSSADDVVKIARVAQAANGNRADILYEAWIQSILSGPTTHIAYKAALAMNSAFEFSIQRGTEALVNLAYRDKDSATFKEFSMIRKAIMPGILNGLSIGARQWQTESDIFEQDVMNSQVEMFDRGQVPATEQFHRPSISETPLTQFFGSNAELAERQFQKLGRFNPVRGRVIRMPTRLLWFIDGFYKSANSQMAVMPIAYRMARREGLEGEALSSRVNELVSTAGSPAWLKAAELANWLAMRERVKTSEQGGNFIDNAVAKIASARNGSHLIGSQLPFVQLPYNLVKIGMSKAFSPVTTAAKFAMAGARALPHPEYDPSEGFFKMKDGKPFFESYSKASQVRDVATSLIALTTATFLWNIVAGDGDDDKKWLLITGSTPHTQLKKGVRELQQRAYGGAYVLRIGGRGGLHFNYGKFEPSATVLGTLADAIVGLKHMVRGQEGGREALDGFAGYLIAQAEEKTFLRALANISRVMSGEMGATDFAAEMAMNGLVPNLVRQPLRNMDDYVRDYKHASTWYRLLPSAGNAEPKIDVYGKPVPKTGNWFTRMFTIAGPKPAEQLQKADALLLRWNNEHPRDAKAPVPPSTTYIDAQGKTQQMTNAQSTKFLQAAGHRFEQMLRGQISQRQIDHPKEEDVKMIENLHRDAAEQIKREMFPKDATVKTSGVNLIRAWKQAA
jgi:RNA polymerase sigma factor (sigma-70 family)